MNIKHIWNHWSCRSHRVGAVTRRQRNWNHHLENILKHLPFPSSSSKAAVSPNAYDQQPTSRHPIAQSYVTMKKDQDLRSPRRKWKNCKHEAASWISLTFRTFLRLSTSSSGYAFITGSCSGLCWREFLKLWSYFLWLAKRIWKRQSQRMRYCWWKKSCTSWYGKYTIIYRVSYIPGCLGFLNHQ